MSEAVTSHLNGTQTEAGTMEMDQRNRKNIVKEILSFINILTILILFCITILVMYHCFKNGIVLFSWHPALMAFGYLCIMSQGILSMSDHNYATKLLTFKARVLAHWIFQTAALISIAIAFLCIYLNKERAEKPHFQSVHGILGLTTFVLTIVAGFGGIFNKYSFKFKKIITPAMMKILHSLAGMSCFILAIVTISFGMYSDWFKKQIEMEGVIIFLIVLLALVTISVLGKSLVLLKTRTQNLVKRATM